MNGCAVTSASMICPLLVTCDAVMRDYPRIAIAYLLRDQRAVFLDLYVEGGQLQQLFNAVYPYFSIVARFTARNPSVSSSITHYRCGFPRTAAIALSLSAIAAPRALWR